MNLNILPILFIITHVSVIFCDPTVPVLLLSNLKFNMPCPAVKHITEEFLRTIMQPFPNWYIFVEKKLSPEDFLNIRPENPIFNTNITKYCPSVTNNFIPYISSKYGENNKINFTSNKVEYIQNYIENSTQNVSYIYFGDEQEYVSRSEMISAHSVFIRNIYEILKTSSKQFLILYTALEPSWVFNTKPNLRHKRNEISKNETLIESDEYLLYFQGAIFVKIIPPILNEESELKLDSCAKVDSGQQNQIKLQCSVRSVTINFTTTQSSWSLKSISIENDFFVKKLKQDLTFYLRDIRAPYGFAYNCAEIKLVQSIPKSNRVLSLSIRGLQIEFFDDENRNQKYFSESFDCSGWTTIPILAGLFVSAILLIILGIGIVMMLDIKANDRFDNPKQKTAALLFFKN